MSGSSALDRIVITRPVVGLMHMQVCVADGVSDDEILEHCNANNHAGTTNGWVGVIRGKDDYGAPVSCEEYPGRTHLLVYC